ncbi:MULTISPECIES: 30S ribosomal protein S24e [Acidiplasma]|jgi:small subunit ribosomal protein S24e|uniref:Small ribosomal subunit protein eS24 n=2 Tax=Acidiplasma TaxID=507753 RepID=A0A0Q0REN2_9ARCH|nr:MULTISPECIES: 30S ribosomal protein S24e [Acidiplasma]KJE49756.1 30S ribosomal protein S24 [Acidiplasma sp. MBA-1]KPV46192.1 30S ribosomal protein S24 [Acidiplasma aeolicum]KQB33545.1 30S ribosomal protein S24 [Acidiplasma cupricumulans]KQB34754.1 30S ribosomal protein S24 [Acidiplasma aeolicum]WMT55711.1 MAG: 30S ribosomal protein S24e [Acidiplasma sp.]
MSESSVKNFNVESEKDNKLLHRKEIRYTMTFSSGITPSRDYIRDLLANYYKVNKELIIVDKNKQETGKDELKGYAKIYDKKENAMLYEPDYELIRNKLKEKVVK